MEDRYAKINILLIDDDRAVRELISLMLRRRGCRVEEAGNGREALDKINKSKPDIILLDAVMPVMSGFETYCCLKRNPKTSDIPIIFCTATRASDIKSGKIKVDDYLIKPFLIEELYKKIIEIADKRK